MSKIILMQGLPASGKSTRAAEILKESGNMVRLNRDLLREMLHCNVWTGKKEGLTIDTQMLLARYFTKNNISVVVDDTNLSQSAVDRWKNYAKDCGATLEIVKMDTSWEECLKRDEAREKKVGRDVIMKMAMESGAFKPQKGYIICDIDGTVAEISHRLHYVKGVEKKDWKGFFSQIPNDKPRYDVIDMVQKYIDDNGYDLVFVSGRSEQHRATTEEWFTTRREDCPLECEDVYKYPELTNLWDKKIALIMRGANDMRDDDIVKKDILDRYFPDKSLVKVVVDDRPRVLRMWEANLPDANILNVGSGVEF